MPGKILTAIVKRIRQMVSSLGEDRDKVAVDEYVLEHLLLYHGLVGSSPENQRSFKEVRSEIRIAVENGNPLQMGIALKLPPLWWEDKLRTIFEEIAPSKETAARAISALYPQPNDSSWPTRLDPLGHNDWHVRANAASILVFLKADAAIERICLSLRDSAANAKSAFCHIAYALGRLESESGRAALQEFLYSDEPWFRVDAAGALAHWPTDVVGENLMQSMLSHHDLSDYMAVAIAKHRAPSEFFALESSAAKEGASAMILGLLEASKQTYSSDLVLETGVIDCAEPLFQLAENDPSPLNTRAALGLAQWIRTHEEDAAAQSAPDNARLDALASSLSADRVAKVVNRCLAKAQTVVSADSAEMRQAIGLAGDFQMQSAVPALTAMLRTDNPLLDPTIEALGRIGDPDTAAALIQLAQQLVNMSQRTALPLSRQPIAEEDARSCKSYWQVLKALGESPADSSIPYLLEATGDYAPDKREQALASLLAAYATGGSKCALHKKSVIAAVTAALNDPAPQLRVVALDGVAQLDESGCIAEVVKMVEAPEISVGRKALSTLKALGSGAHKKEVCKALTEAINAHGDDYQRKQLVEFLAELSAKH
ncbi:MAG TPA: HEAT repeat domain-containing protein [Trichormus sp.]|jgi:HEAT repeat protein